MSEVKNILTPIKAIRAKCLDCCCGQYKEVELCPCPDCTLHPYRFGKNPNIKLTDEQRAKRTSNFKKTSRLLGEKPREPATEGSYTLRPTGGINRAEGGLFVERSIT